MGRPVNKYRPWLVTPDEYRVAETWGQMPRLVSAQKPMPIQLPGDLHLLPFSFTFMRVLLEDRGVLRVDASVIDVNDGRPTLVGTNRMIDPFHNEARSDMLTRLVRGALLGALIHELDECLRNADGSHVNNPHR